MRVYQPYPSYTSAVLVSKETSGKNKSKKEKKKTIWKIERKDTNSFFHLEFRFLG